MEADDRVVIVVDVEPAVVWPDVPHARELGGHLMGVLELGLVDLVDVVPRVDGAVAPGLSEPLLEDAERWRARVGVAPRGDVLSFGLLLCPDDPAKRPPAPPGDEEPTLDAPDAPGERPACWNLEAVGLPEAPEAAMAVLLGQAVNVLGQPTADGASRDWGRPQSADAYAVLVTGRAAAVAYGFRPPVEDAHRGDVRRDALARAVFLDPGTSLGWWLVGRRAAALGEGWDAREAFARGLTARPASVGLRAAEASALATLGKWEIADARWEEIEAVSPGDLRFAVPRARAALEAGRPTAARAVLDALGARFQGNRTVAELRVAIADVVGRGEDYDALLVGWQDAAPESTEPVRRRIALRIDDRRYGEAYALTSTLAARGAAREAALLATALAIGLGDLDGAAVHADDADRREVAARIRARAALQARPDVVPPSLAEAADRWALLASGEALLAADRPAEALARANAALAAAPDLPEALDLRVRSASALGRTAEAEAARARLRWADPDYGT